jgi:predicted TPR repeat methyltransferase
MMRADYTDIFRRPAAVERYETVVYSPDSYASAVNRRQRAYLRGLARRAFDFRRPVQHDFACGSGRAIRLLHGLVRSAHGYDTSAAMLAKAREGGVYARLHEIPESGPVPTPATGETPVIVTVFRLLLNVDPGVRDRAIAFAAKALPHYGSGLLVVENHGNRDSIRHLRHRRRAGDPWFAELSHEEVAQLLDRHGFGVVERRGFALLPQGWHGRRWLRPFARLVDEVGCRIPALAPCAVNVLYVARRVHAGFAPADQPAHPDATTW